MLGLSFQFYFRQRENGDPPPPNPIKALRFHLISANFPQSRQELKDQLSAADFCMGCLLQQLSLLQQLDPAAAVFCISWFLQLIPTTAASCSKSDSICLLQLLVSARSWILQKAY